MNKTFFQKNLTTILIIAATLILGGVAVFTAIKLYQLRSVPVAPNVPESSPQAANEGVVLSIPLNTVVRGPGLHELANQNVSQYSGLVCTVTVDARNQESVHPDNNLIISSGGDSVIVEDVEGEALGAVSANKDLTLGNEIKVELDMGPDEVFSAGLDVSLNCKEPTPTSPPQVSLEPCTALTFTLASSTASASPSTSPSASPSSSPTSSASATPTTIATSTPKPTTSPTTAATVAATATPASLPQAGVSLPTILGVGAGALLLLVALAFAL